MKNKMPGASACGGKFKLEKIHHGDTEAQASPERFAEARNEREGDQAVKVK